MQRGGCVYIMTNKNNTTLYTGVTADLQTRIWQHITHFHPKSFTARYDLTKYSTIEEAIAIEKQIKAGSRKIKEAFIIAANPEWLDLYITNEIEKW